MTVEQTDVVDGIGTDEEMDRVVLVIADHLPWTSDDHLLLLQEKINSYLGFIENGELAKLMPDAISRFLEIRITCQYPPDEGGISFLEDVKQSLERFGIALTHTH